MAARSPLRPGRRPRSVLRRLIRRAPSAHEPARVSVPRHNTATRPGRNSSQIAVRPSRTAIATASRTLIGQLPRQDHRPERVVLQQMRVRPGDGQRQNRQMTEHDQRHGAAGLQRPRHQLGVPIEARSEWRQQQGRQHQHTDHPKPVGLRRGEGGPGHQQRIVRPQARLTRCDSPIAISTRPAPISDGTNWPA